MSDDFHEGDRVVCIANSRKPCCDGRSHTPNPPEVGEVYVIRFLVRGRCVDCGSVIGCLVTDHNLPLLPWPKVWFKHLPLTKIDKESKNVAPVLEDA